VDRDTDPLTDVVQAADHMTVGNARICRIAGVRHSDVYALFSMLILVQLARQHSTISLLRIPKEARSPIRARLSGPLTPSLCGRLLSVQGQPCLVGPGQRQ
jgi:hypothetical protein